MAVRTQPWQSKVRHLAFILSLLSCATQDSSSQGLDSSERHRLLSFLVLPAVQMTRLPMADGSVHRMVYRFGKVFLENECTILGAIDGPECDSFNRSAFRSPSQVVAAMSDKSSPASLYYLEATEPSKLLDGWIEGRPDAKLPEAWADGGIRRIFHRQREIVESLVARLEDIYKSFSVPDPNFSPASLFNETVAGSKQVNWAATYQKGGRFKGRSIAESTCAFHKPSTETLDRLRVDNDVLRINDACESMMQNAGKVRDIGLTFQMASSVNGVTMDYPASIRGLAFDNRFEKWFAKSIYPPKDIVIVVDHSGSMEAAAPCGALKIAEAQIKSIFRSFVTEQDRVQLILMGEDPQMSPCFGSTQMVAGSRKNVDALLDWFYRASSERRGVSQLASGVLEALSIMDQAKQNGESTGGARFVMVITDGLQVGDVIEKGFRRYATESGTTYPLDGVHMVGVVLVRPGTRIEERTPLDAAACAQRGVVWKLMSAEDSMVRDGCGLEEVEIAIEEGNVSFRTAPSLLLNATDLMELAAFPFSLPADQGGLPSLHWHNLRADMRAVNESAYRPLLGVSKPFFDKRSDPPLAAGVAHAEFLMDDFAHTLNAIKRPALTHLAILKHENDIGHVLAHTSSAPEYSDYVDLKTRDGDFDISIIDLEGTRFETEGVLDALVQQDEGSKTIERKKVVDHDWSPARDANLEHLVREDLDLVTYFWKRIPGTSFTMLISVVGTPTEPGGKVVLTPTLRAPRPCPAGAGPNASLSLHADGSCWTSSYTAFPSVYHRLDLLDQSAMPARTMAAPFGGPSACCCSQCTFDTSTWISSSLAFASGKSYLEDPLTADKIDAINKEMLGKRTDEAMLGGGLRPRAMSALKVTSNMEAFWKDVLGVKGADAVGNALELDDTKADIRRDVLQLFFTTESGVQRMYPGLMAAVPIDYNVRRAPFYTRALSYRGDMAVSQPYRPVGINTSLWVVTLSKAIFHTPVREVESEKQQIFGVTGVHYRFDAFVKAFRKATTLRDILKFGCGDMGTSQLADRGLACFLVNENAHVLLDRGTMMLGEQHPDLLGFDPAMRNLHMEEPFIMEQLLSAKAIVRDQVRYGSKQHVAYRVLDKTLLDFSKKKRAAARATGEIESELTGIELLKRVQTPNGFTLNYIWFYQVPRTRTYLLVVSGYVPVPGSRDYFCGSLSKFCPSVFDPMETNMVESTCNISSHPKTRPRNYTYVGPNFQQLRKLHQFQSLEASYFLECPREFQMWTISLLVIGGVLLIIVVILLVNLIMTRARRRHAALTVAKLASKGPELSHVTPQEESTSDEPLSGDLSQGPKLVHYKMLAANQWQLAEDLSKRDQGEARAMALEIAGLNGDAQGLFAQLDYLQHRVQKQEVLRPKFNMLRRQVSGLSQNTTGMQDEVDALKAEGHLPGLDPTLEEDATELRTSLAGEALPSGTREALFHRIHHPHLVDRKLLRQERPAHSSMQDGLP